MSDTCFVLHETERERDGRFSKFSKCLPEVALLVRERVGRVGMREHALVSLTLLDSVDTQCT